MNVFDEMNQAMQEAELRMRAADEVAGKVARMLVGRLKRVDSAYTLGRLKRELRDFNIHTGSWKE